MKELFACLANAARQELKPNLKVTMMLNSMLDLFLTTALAVQAWLVAQGFSKKFRADFDGDWRLSSSASSNV